MHILRLVQIENLSNNVNIYRYGIVQKYLIRELINKRNDTCYQIGFFEQLYLIHECVYHVNITFMFDLNWIICFMTNSVISVTPSQYFLSCFFSIFAKHCMSLNFYKNFLVSNSCKNKFKVRWYVNASHILGVRSSH